MISYARGLHRLSSARTVSVVQRRRGLPAATSLRDLADEYAEVIRQEWGQADLMGFSRGGAIAQHVALDHPESVQSLSHVISGAKLESVGRDSCIRWLGLVQAGRWAQLRGELVRSAIDGDVSGRLTEAYSRLPGEACRRHDGRAAGNVNARPTGQGLDRPGAGRPLVVVVPAILEELGWRGFGVQSAVEQGRSPAWAALVVGKLFLALHIHLYLPSQRYAGLPFWLLPLTLLALTLLASLVLLTWIYLRTRSVLITGLMHAAFNATVPLTWGLPAGWVWEARAIILILIAALVVGRVGITWWRSPLPAAEEARHDYAR